MRIQKNHYGSVIELPMAKPHVMNEKAKASNNAIDKKH